MKIYTGKIRLKIGYDMDSMIDMVCGLSIIMIMPIFFSINSFINYGIRWGLGLVFLFCVARKDAKLFTELVVVLTSGMLYTLLYMYNVRMAYGEGQASFITRSMLCWLYMAYAVYYAKHRYNTNNQVLGKIFTIVLIITAITSVIGMHKYSYLASGYETIVRTLGNGGDYSEESRKLINRSNISSWQLAYGFALSNVVYVWRFKQERKKLYVFAIVVTIFFLVEAQITFALIFSIIPVIHYFVRRKSKTAQVITYFILIIVSIVVYFNISSLFYLLYKKMTDIGMTMLGIRFYQLYEASRIGGLIGTSAGRMKMYLLSLRQFLDHPIFGYKLKDYSELFTKLGMHSQVFDTLGGTGIVGFMLYFSPFLYVIKNVKKPYTDFFDKSFANLGIIILLLFMLTNPTTYTCEAYMAVFCLPLWLKSGNEDYTI